MRGVARLLLTGYAWLVKGRYLIERRMGLRLLLDQTNVIDQEVLIKGAWEQAQLDYLFALAADQRRRQGSGAVFIDVGAHWGLYALEACRSGMFVETVAVEPDPTNFAQLQANLFLNGCENSIRTLQVAATDHERTFGLSVGTPRNRGGTTVVDVGQPHHATCRGVRLDGLLDFPGKLLVIKIDVEGHEREAVRGLGRLLASNRCVLQVEAWSEGAEMLEQRVHDLKTLLAGFGLEFLNLIDCDCFFVTKA